jgi:Aldolase/RraA
VPGLTGLTSMQAMPTFTPADLVPYSAGRIESAVARLNRRPRGEGLTLPVLALIGARWKHLERAPGPKVAVAHDVSRQRGAVAVCGRLNGYVLRALGCAGMIADGHVRHRDDLRAAGLAVLTLPNGNPHIERWGEPVTVAGMRASPGNAVMAAAEGAIAFPVAWLADLPRVLDEVARRVDPVVSWRQSPGVTD